MSYQKLIIIGNLGRDPEMRYTPSGDPVTSFNVASNRTYTDGSGTRQKETTWFRVSVWGKQAESCNTYLQKGSMVLVEGELKPDKETGAPHIFNRADGSPATSYEVTARNVRFLTPRGTSPDEMVDEGGDLGEEDIPF